MHLDHLRQTIHRCVQPACWKVWDVAKGLRLFQNDAMQLVSYAWVLHRLQSNSVEASFVSLGRIVCT